MAAIDNPHYVSWRTLHDLMARVPDLDSPAYRRKHADEHVCITDKKRVRIVKLFAVLERQGGVRTVETNTKRALNFAYLHSDVAPSEKQLDDWRNFALQQWRTAEKLNRIGFLSLATKLVTVKPLNRETGVLAYVHPTYEYLKEEEGLRIIDSQHSGQMRENWIRGGDFLFKSDEQRLREENWDPVIDSLLTDVAKIVAYQIPIHNIPALAVVPKPSVPICYHEVRWFYNASPRGMQDMPAQMRLRSIQGEENIARLQEEGRQILSKLLDELFSCEFHARYGEDKADRFHALKNQLVAKHADTILARAMSIISRS